MAFVDAYRDRFGVEPICKALQIASSVYYARKSRSASARSRRDSELKVAISHIYATNYRVYGAKKIWIALKHEGITDCGRDRVSRLMGDLGIAGISRRGRKPVTTKPDHEARRAPDLVKRQFSADVPNRLWVADITYVPTFAHMTYVAFVTDVFSRRIVGWAAATNMQTGLVMTALEMALWRRDSQLDGLICHSDAGSQYTSIRYTERLGEIGAAPSIGSVGDSFDNALAEATNGTYKAELVWNLGPWRNLDHLELATFEWVEWYNNKRIHHITGGIPPTEYEQNYQQTCILISS